MAEKPKIIAHFIILCLPPYDVLEGVHVAVWAIKCHHIFYFGAYLYAALNL